MGLISRKKGQVITGLELSAPPTDLQGKRDGVGQRLNSKNVLNYKIQRASRLMNASTCWEGGIAQVHGNRNSCARDPSGPCPL